MWQLFWDAVYIAESVRGRRDKGGSRGRRQLTAPLGRPRLSDFISVLNLSGRSDCSQLTAVSHEAQIVSDDLA